MALLPVPEIVKEMADKLELMTRSMERQNKQLEEIRKAMVTAERVQFFGSRLDSLEASLLAMKTELTSVLASIKR